MQYFKKDFISFFADLEKNNNRDWFNAHKKTYTEAVKSPFEKFISDLIQAIHKIEPEVNIPAKDAIFRIYRDVRFSKDKEPYKAYCSAVISKYGRKDRSYPGMYVMISAEKMMLGGGLYQPDKDSLYDLRETIAKDPERFRGLIEEKSYHQLYGELLGEKNKIIPKEFKEAAAKEPYLFHKQFYYMADFPVNSILSEDLLEVAIDAYQTSKAFKDYLIKATGVK